MLQWQMDQMPERLQQAARFVISHPVDVALYSMRVQARRAGVSHSTMVRLAEWIGLDGYNTLRAIYQRGLKAGAIQDGSAVASVEAIASITRAPDGVRLPASGVEQLGNDNNLRRHQSVAKALSIADQVICMAEEEEFAVATYFQQLMKTKGRVAVTIKPAGATPTTDLKYLRPSHAMLAICGRCATPQMANMARYAKRRGASVATLTNCPRSSIAHISHETVVLPHGFSIAPTVATIVAAVEIIASMIE